MFYHDTTSVLQAELLWLQKMMQFRSHNKQTDCRLVPELSPPELPQSEETLYCRFCHEYELTMEDRLLLILSLAPTIAPQFLDKELLIWIRQSNSSEAQPIWGLVYGGMYKGVLPSPLLFMYILVGDVFEKRLPISKKILNFAYKSLDKELVFLSNVPVAEPKLAGILSINEAYLPQLIN